MMETETRLPEKRRRRATGQELAVAAAAAGPPAAETRLAMRQLQLTKTAASAAPADTVSSSGGESLLIRTSAGAETTSKMQQILRALGRRPRPRRARKLSNAAQLKQTQEGVIDLETPDSILTRVQVKPLLCRPTFCRLPSLYQLQLARMLPDADAPSGSDGAMKLGSASLNNEFLARACQQWQERLRRGEFTHENQHKHRAELDMMKRRLDPWKARNFEPIWGRRPRRAGSPVTSSAQAVLSTSLPPAPAVVPAVPALLTVAATSATTVAAPAASAAASSAATAPEVASPPVVRVVKRSWATPPPEAAEKEDATTADNDDEWSSPHDVSLESAWSSAEVEDTAPDEDGIGEEDDEDLPEEEELERLMEHVEEEEDEDDSPEDAETSGEAGTQEGDPVDPLSLTETSTSVGAELRNVSSAVSLSDRRESSAKTTVVSAESLRPQMAVFVSRRDARAPVPNAGSPSPPRVQLTPVGVSRVNVTRDRDAVTSQAPLVVTPVSVPSALNIYPVSSVVASVATALATRSFVATPSVTTISITTANSEPSSPCSEEGEAVTARRRDSAERDDDDVNSGMVSIVPVNFPVSVATSLSVAQRQTVLERPVFTQTSGEVQTTTSTGTSPPPSFSASSPGVPPSEPVSTSPTECSSQAEVASLQDQEDSSLPENGDVTRLQGSPDREASPVPSDVKQDTDTAGGSSTLDEETPMEIESGTVEQATESHSDDTFKEQKNIVEDSAMEEVEAASSAAVSDSSAHEAQLSDMNLHRNTDDKSTESAPPAPTPTTSVSAAVAPPYTPATAAQTIVQVQQQRLPATLAAQPGHAALLPQPTAAQRLPVMAQHAQQLPVPPPQLSVSPPQLPGTPLQPRAAALQQQRPQLPRLSAPRPVTPPVSSAVHQAAVASLSGVRPPLTTAAVAPAAGVVATSSSPPATAADVPPTTTLSTSTVAAAVAAAVSQGKGKTKPRAQTGKTGKASRPPAGSVNLERSYQICQAVIAKSQNRAQLQAQLKPLPAFLAERRGVQGIRRPAAPAVGGVARTPSPHQAPHAMQVKYVQMPGQKVFTTARVVAMPPAGTALPVQGAPASQQTPPPPPAAGAPPCSQPGGAPAGPGAGAGPGAVQQVHPTGPHDAVVLGELSENGTVVLRKDLLVRGKQKVYQMTDSSGKTVLVMRPVLDSPRASSAPPDRPPAAVLHRLSRPSSTGGAVQLSQVAPPGQQGGQNVVMQQQQFMQQHQQQQMMSHQQMLQQQQMQQVRQQQAVGQQQQQQQQQQQMMVQQQQQFISQQMQQQQRQQQMLAAQQHQQMSLMQQQRGVVPPQQRYMLDPNQNVAVRPHAPPQPSALGPQPAQPPQQWSQQAAVHYRAAVTAAESPGQPPPPPPPPQYVSMNQQVVQIQNSPNPTASGQPLHAPPPAPQPPQPPAGAQQQSVFALHNSGRPSPLVKVGGGGGGAGGAAGATSGDCGCSLKPLVMCQKCGAFCHDDCMPGPPQPAVCNTCLACS